MSRSLAYRLISLSALTLVAACGPDTGQGVDEANQLPYAENSPEALAVLEVANDKSLGVEEFDASDQVGLHKRAAENIVAYRDGDPETTEDDREFQRLAELYGISYCKTTCINKILDYAKETGVYGGGGEGNIEAIFSPQAMNDSHLQEVADRIDQAQETIDIAMYSYSHQDPVRGALERALARGVKIRFLANSDLANSSSKGGGLEEMGIDVRRVTKIMHHKFAIIDGPRDNESLERAGSATVMSGSANWSSSAATIYDENTLFFSGYAELTLKLQRDFDYLWAGSKDVVYQDYEWDQTRADITDQLIAENDDPNTDVFFTSVNFEPYGNQGWSYLGTAAVTDQLVAGIASATDSLEIASGHFVSEPIAEAVATAIANNPDLEVEIVLDCQEASNSYGAIGDFKEDIESRGGSIYYKCNTYRWHYKFAQQMHHKYMIVDGDELYTGSLNFSDNAETNTFENMFLFKGAEHAAIVQSYQANFDMVRNYGRADDMLALQELEDDILNGSYVPLKWDPAISMDIATFWDLKDLIRQECPAAGDYNSPEGKTYNKWFTQYPYWFDTCQKDGYPWPEVPEDKRVQ